jgi:hypothetical protein
MATERAREIADHEAGVGAERDIETKGGRIDREVEIDQEGLAAKRGDHVAERDRDQAKSLSIPKMNMELAMKKDR